MDLYTIIKSKAKTLNKSEGIPINERLSDCLPSGAQLLMRRSLNFDYSPVLSCALCTMLTPAP